MNFDSLEYAWKDLEVVLLGRPLVRILEVSYTVEAAKTKIYGRGKKALGIQDGNESVSGSITVGQSELEALVRAVQAVRPDGKITDFSFDLSISYVSAARIVRDRVVGCKFTSVPKGMSQGDSDSTHQLSFEALDIKFNV
jgi:hypothetical protein